jgi:UDP-GlcNAc:undecaprenyl-phosphate/decaprenyl-phosphate GlcNAc-1-phosphate transferase
MIVPYLILTVVLMLVAIAYFRIADRYAIIDKPNQRSSHQKPVIRGGGIVFIVAIVLWFLYEGFAWPWFIVGVTAAAIISFLDDISPQPAGRRFLIHFVAVVLLLVQVAAFSWPWWLVLPVLIVCIGTLNAFNFMDGINGITGIYALVSLLSMGYVNRYVLSFTSETLIGATLAAVLVFLFFNFRKKARCFAGDVGSVTIAFVLIFILLQLIRASGNFWWVLIFWMYGVDSVITILYRLKYGENIFKPHRKHLYQYLSNEFRWPHRSVAVLYGVLQAGINAVLIYAVVHDSIAFAAYVVSAVGVLYVIVREYVLRRMRLAGVDLK